MEMRAGNCVVCIAEFNHKNPYANTNRLACRITLSHNQSRTCHDESITTADAET
jgi:hypothetical protein